jgi:hypothetical protein
MMRLSSLIAGVASVISRSEFLPRTCRCSKHEPRITNTRPNPENQLASTELCVRFLGGFLQQERTVC